MRGLNGKNVLVTGGASGIGQAYVMDGAETTGGLCSQWSHE